MNSALLLIVSYVLNAAWQIPLLAAAGWLAARLLRRWGPRAQHVAWVAVFLLCVIAPGLVVRPGVLRLIAMARPGESGGSSLAAISGNSGEILGRGVFLLLPPWLVWLLLAFYVASLLYFVARLLWLLAATRRLVDGATEEGWTSYSAQALWARTRVAFGGIDVAVLASKQVGGAMTVGALRPSILLPEGFISESDEQDLLSALGHEMAHVVRRDYAKNLLYEIACIAVAFHPIVWIVKKQIIETREMICDAIVADRLVHARAYRQALLRMAQRVTSTETAIAHAVGIFDGDILEKRIMNLKTKRIVLGSFARTALAGCAAVLLAATVVGALAFARPVNTPQAYQDAPGTVYKIGNGVSAPVVIHTVEARFSDKARSAKYQGVCLISLVVDAEGNPQNVRVARALGMGLDKNAVDAVRQYKFKPALKDGKTPVPVAITIEVDFRLY